ncbi:hypothetical protein H6763_03055 [Candidatus Nomurabacteria bacterium]|uniref:Uncharacterized protein n=1 Tax=Candidatus Dojkabacteria bacterium TaxID=2099670 RepID=A0A955I353_9BACT|nr:hypothetical protein [Candidatus Dojkabacteria bacterium]MCB9789463.1 hypothetical protein [Candidatus Nomurabacteria bacterium]MCB9803785.1 hypothetical protein [Candidatus Nomurabacteria bacterium]
MNFLDGLSGPTPSVSFLGINFVFKLLFFVLLVGYILYSFLLLLRVRILADTIKTPHSGKVMFATTIHLLISLIGGFLAMILILLA